MVDLGGCKAKAELLHKGVDLLLLGDEGKQVAHDGLEVLSRQVSFTGQAGKHVWQQVVDGACALHHGQLLRVREAVHGGWGEEQEMRHKNEEDLLCGAWGNTDMLNKQQDDGAKCGPHVESWLGDQAEGGNMHKQDSHPSTAGDGEPSMIIDT